MKKLVVILVALFLFISPVNSIAVEDNYDYEPEAGEGWLTCTINDETVKFNYVGSVKSMADTTHQFNSDKYTLSLVFNKDLEIGKMMSLNAIKSIELISSVEATAGYYATKKTRNKDVESEVLLEEAKIDEIIQGTFSVVVTPADRWVGDLRPGILPSLPLKDGEFCFYPASESQK